MAILTAKPKKAKNKRIWISVILAIIIFSGGIIYIAKKFLPRVALAQLAEITNTVIKAENVDVDLNGWIHIHNLAISPDIIEINQDDNIFRAEKLHAKFSTLSLLSLNPVLDRITVKNFLLNASYDFDREKWNITSLNLKMPGEKNKDFVSSISLENGLLQYSKINNGQKFVSTQIPIDAQFEYDDHAYNFQINTAPMKTGQSTLKGRWEPGHLSFAGSVSSDNIPAFEMAWIFNIIAADLEYDRNNNFKLDISIKDLINKYELKAIDSREPSLLRSISTLNSLEKILSRYNPAGKMDVEMTASGNLDKLKESTVQGKLKLKKITAVKQDFPYRLNQLQGTIFFDELGVKLDNLHGKHGQTDIYINGWSIGFGNDYHCNINVKSPNMVLGPDLYNALDKKTKKLWDRYQPTGVTALDYTFIKNLDGTRSQPFTLSPVDVNAVYTELPYPLKNLKGDIHFREGITYIENLRCSYSGKQIEINGQITDSPDSNTFDLTIDANDIPLDDTLFDALPARKFPMVNKNNIKGSVDAKIRVHNKIKDINDFTYSALINFQNAALKNLMDEYDFEAISGKALFEPHNITLKNISCKKDYLKFRVSGNIDTTNEFYDISITGRGADVNDLLKHAPPEYRAGTSELNPAGPADYQLDIQKQDKTKPAYKLTLWCKGNEFTVPGSSLRLKDAKGKIRLSEGKITFKDFKFKAPFQPHQSRSTMVLNGDLFPEQNGIKKASLLIAANRFRFTEPVETIIPSSFKKVFTELSPSGTYSFSPLKIDFSRNPAGQTDMEVKGRIAVENSCLKIKPPVSDIDAEVTLSMALDSNKGIKKAAVTLYNTSLKLSGKTISDMNTRFDYNPSDYTFSGYMNGICHSGKITGNLVFISPPESGGIEYKIRAAFDDIDLKNFLSESSQTADNESSEGLMQGSVNLSGNSANKQSLRGRCRLLIQDMKIARTSPLTNLLDVIQLNEPSDYFFDEMLVEGWLHKDKILFETIDISGTNAAFHGKGKMLLADSSLDLKMTARGKRNPATEPGIIQSLTDMVRGSVIRLEVTGNLNDPKVQTKALPLIDDSLKILGSQK